MLVLLPPSETKAPGGDGPALKLDTLTLPELNPVRGKIAAALVELAADVPASQRALGLSARQRAEVVRNAELFSAPTLPALARYTGVLYDALEVNQFSKTTRGKANHRLAIASALFGMLRPADRIPAYRLSGNSSVPALGPLPALWRPALEPALADPAELVVDLRSGSYAGLARIPHAVTVRVTTEDEHGNRKTISHHNKAYKGKLAKILVEASRAPSTVDGLLRQISRAGLRVERTGDRALDLRTD